MISQGAPGDAFGHPPGTFIPPKEDSWMDFGERIFPGIVKTAKKWILENPSKLMVFQWFSMFFKGCETSLLLCFSMKHLQLLIFNANFKKNVTRLLEKSKIEAIRAPNHSVWSTSTAPWDSFGPHPRIFGIPEQHHRKQFGEKKHIRKH